MPCAGCVGVGRLVALGPLVWILERSARHGGIPFRDSALPGRLAFGRGVIAMLGVTVGMAWAGSPPPRLMLSEDGAYVIDTVARPSD